MTIDSLRGLAAQDATWADERIKVYNADGATTPEPIRRLKALADLALTHTPKPADTCESAAEDRDRLNALIRTMRTVLGAREEETVEDAAARVVASVQEERARARAVAIRALRDVASVTMGVADDLQQLDAKTTILSAQDLNGEPIAIKLTHPAGTSVAMVNDGRAIAMSRPGPHPSIAVSNGSPGGTDADLVMGAKGPALVTTHEPGTNSRERTQIALSHGLVLLNLEQKHCAVITEPTEGRWFAQTILTDGKLSDTFATHPGQWYSDKWEPREEIIAGIAPHWKAAQKGEQTMIPGSGPLPSAPPAESAKKRVGDWTPTDAEIAGYSKSIGEKSGKVASIDEIKKLVASFKEAKKDTDLTNPGLSFYHWAVKQLKGA